MTNFLKRRGLRLTYRGKRVYAIVEQVGDVVVLVLTCASLWAIVLMAGARSH